MVSHIICSKQHIFPSITCLEVQSYPFKSTFKIFYPLLSTIYPVSQYLCFVFQTWVLLKDVRLLHPGRTCGVLAQAIKVCDIRHPGGSIEGSFVCIWEHFPDVTIQYGDMVNTSTVPLKCSVYTCQQKIAFVTLLTFTEAGLFSLCSVSFDPPIIQRKEIAL